MLEKQRIPARGRLRDYEPVVGRSVLDELRILAEVLSGKVIQNINSTFVGGGVAEMLERNIPLLNQLGVDARWDIIRGDSQFFDVTKKIHNALHGNGEALNKSEIEIFNEVTSRNLKEMNFYGDILYIHDPQPAGLIAKKKELGKKWIWRCHIDVSKPQCDVWEFLRGYVVDYDAAIFSAPYFGQSLPVRQFMITPAIDPLSDKNRDMDEDAIKAVLQKYSLTSGKPMILQVSRFDRLKDPLGVIEAFKIVRRNVDCQLVLAGGTADDDPESSVVLNEVQEKTEGEKDIHILLIPPESDLEINALQSAATVIVQKSLKEGFGLTISEALWKGKPVVASAVGGIPLQIKNKLTGLLCYSVEGAAYDIRRLLLNPEYAQWLGKNGKEHVKQNFLVTTYLRNYLLALIALDYQTDIIQL